MRFDLDIYDRDLETFLDTWLKELSPRWHRSSASFESDMVSGFTAVDRSFRALVWVTDWAGDNVQFPSLKKSGRFKEGQLDRVD